MIGLVAFSFARRDVAMEPNPCNIKLGDEVLRIVSTAKGPVTVAAQWEVARHLESKGYNPDLIIELRSDGEYLNSKDVLDGADRLFQSLGITEVIPVANPWLHLRFGVKPLLRDKNYSIVKCKIRWIGFDNTKFNWQWWTKGLVRLTVYSVLLKLKVIPNGFMERQPTN